MELLLPKLGLLVWTLLAFIIVFLILRKFAWKPILQSLNDREKNITEAILSAEKIKIEMASLKSENEALLISAREERAMMLKDAKDTRDKIVNEAKDQARLETSKIIADAQAVINQQKMAAVTDLKNQVGKLVLEVSEKILRRELKDKGEQENYIKQLAAEVELT